MANSFFARLGGAARRLLVGEPPVRKSIRGTGNVFQAGKASLSNVELDIVGDRNRITVGEGCSLYNLKFRLRGSDHVIEIGPGCRVTRGGLFWIEDDHCSLTIGQGTTMVEVHIAVTEAGSKVVIGEECMFANDIDVRTGDSHSILDAATGERINFAENVTIGRHVWVASHVIILKGVELGENSVVAAGSVVTRSCGPGSILAGNPAKAIKDGISWKRERIGKE
jgi:acetyltransferase-like isoleucine patch superfamily enzyme